MTATNKQKGKHCYICGAAFSKTDILADYWERVEDPLAKICPKCRETYPIPDPRVGNRFWDSRLENYVEINKEDIPNED